MSSNHNPYQSESAYWESLSTFRRAELLRSARRNDSCPCGSGKKFKKCHMTRFVPVPKQVLTFPGQKTLDVAAMIKAGTGA